MEFETGKLREVALHHHASVRREYLLFWTLVAATWLPYTVAAYFYPLGTVCVMLFMAYFQVLATLARSSGTSTSHYLRFLLSGSNPIGMTGGSSLLFGAVDAIFDWQEDAASRKQNRLLFWAQTLLKFVLTPIGLILLLMEFAWDLLMLRSPRLWILKWRELFSLARYHDIICPEKSNDVFYADLAISRYQNDPYLYQWNRMRAMVFELKQYYDDAVAGVGVPESNLLLQSDIAAYQSLKRLQIEHIETAIQDHYADHLEEFPFPRHLASRLIKSARPISHYQKMRSELSKTTAGLRYGQRFGDLLRENYYEEVDIWKVLRLLDAESPFTPAISRHVTQSDLNSLCAWGILDRRSDFEFSLSHRLLTDWEGWLRTKYTVQPQQTMELVAVELIPDFFLYQGKLYVPNS